MTKKKKNNLQFSLLWLFCYRIICYNIYLLLCPGSDINTWKRLMGTTYSCSPIVYEWRKVEINDLFQYLSQTKCCKFLFCLHLPSQSFQTFSLKCILLYWQDEALRYVASALVLTAKPNFPDNISEGRAVCRSQQIFYVVYNCSYRNSWG